MMPAREGTPVSASRLRGGVARLRAHTNGCESHRGLFANARWCDDPAMRLPLIFTPVLAVLLFGSGANAACIDVRPATWVPESFARSALVFSGTRVAQAPLVDPMRETLTFTVNRIWKGTLPRAPDGRQRVTVFRMRSSEDTYQFRAATEYILFARLLTPGDADWPYVPANVRPAYQVYGGCGGRPDPPGTGAILDTLVNSSLPLSRLEGGSFTLSSTYFGRTVFRRCDLVVVYQQPPSPDTDRVELRCTPNAVPIVRELVASRTLAAQEVDQLAKLATAANLFAGGYLAEPHSGLTAISGTLESHLLFRCCGREDKGILLVTDNPSFATGGRRELLDLLGKWDESLRDELMHQKLR